MMKYVITNPADPTYHHRDPGRTGRLLCRQHYLLGIDKFLDAPPPDKNLCPGCARALQGHAPQLIGDETKSAHSPHPRSKEHHE